jgi:predicted lipoprotein with Yx(FWY)xxD motif
MRRLLLILSLLAVIGVLVVAGGLSGASAATNSPVTVTVSKSNLGMIVTDAKHRTLYLFKKDKNGMSSCSGACASLWPPLITNGKPKAAGGIQASHLGTTKRSDGKLQVTYFKNPLYYYAPDHNPGQTTGQGLNQFGGLWWVVAPSGKAITKS